MLSREAGVGNMKWALWLVPWVLGFGLLGARLAFPVETFRARFMLEQGPVELGTVVILIAALALALRRAFTTGQTLQRVWLTVFAAGCFYFAGEELSWGQHLLGWETPEAIAALNDQQETNLHNMSSWLDQKPRLALELWIVIGALLALGRAALKRSPLADPWRWMWPGLPCVSAGLAVLLFRLPERLADVWSAAAAAPFDIRLAELQELLIAVHLLTYAWFFAARGNRPSA
ncbi:MAG: hypothetical protein AAGA23_06130 [Pseudomonadota bacterium]